MPTAAFTAWLQQHKSGPWHVSECHGVFAFCYDTGPVGQFMHADETGQWTVGSFVEHAGHTTLELTPIIVGQTRDLESALLELLYLLHSDS